MGGSIILSLRSLQSRMKRVDERSDFRTLKPKDELIGLLFLGIGITIVHSFNFSRSSSVSALFFPVTRSLGISVKIFWKDETSVMISMRDEYSLAKDGEIW